MPRWPVNPDKWEPRGTTHEIETVGIVQCVATFVKSEDEGENVRSNYKWSDSRHEWVRNQRTHWNVTLTFNGQEITSPFSQGSAYDKPPTAQDVASSLALDASCGTMTFDEFAGEFGYDSDSRTAYATWETCRDTELRMRRMFGDKFDTLTEWSSEQ